MEKRARPKSLRLGRLVWAVESRLLGWGYTLAKTFLGRNTPALAAVSAIVELNEQLLLLERSDGLGWCLPGGMVRHDETAEQALLREVIEETGYLVQPDFLLGVYSEKGRDPRCSCICVVYACHTVRGQKRDSVEGNVSWFSKRQLPPSLAFDTEHVIIDYLEDRLKRL